MLVSAQTQLEDVLLTLLAQGGNQTVSHLLAELKKIERPASIQGIYRVLRKLQRDGVVVKNKNHYNLRLAWLLSFSELADKMEQTYLQGEYLRQLLPKHNQKYVWRFSNLFKLNNFWSQILIAMARQSPKKLVLNYSPHLWYILIHREQENQFSVQYFGEIKSSYLIVGSRSWLDKYSLDLFDPSTNQKEHLYFADESAYIEKKRSHYLDIVGDYILSVSLDEETTAAMEKLYQETTGTNALQTFAFDELWTRRIRAKVSLKKDPLKAQFYYKKFEKIFGPLR